MLRDLNHEFASRFIDELLLCDQKAKIVGSLAITTRASLGACIGEGNMHFFKYSLFGHLYLLLQAIITEATISATATTNEPSDTGIIQLLSDKRFHSRLKLFYGKIAATKLANTADRCYRKYINDYKIGSFFSDSLNGDAWKILYTIAVSNSPGQKIILILIRRIISIDSHLYYPWQKTAKLYPST